MKSLLSSSSGLLTSDTQSSTAKMLSAVGLVMDLHPTALTVWDQLSVITSTCWGVKVNSEPPSSRPNTLQQTLAAKPPVVLPISCAKSKLCDRQNARARAAPRIFASQPGWPGIFARKLSA